MCERNVQSGFNCDTRVLFSEGGEKIEVRRMRGVKSV